MSAIVREVTIGDCRLIQGDCLEVMPLLGKVDAVVTDPPYGIDPDGAGYGRQGRAIANDKNLEVVAEALRVCGSMYVDCWYALFHSPRNAPDFYKITDWLTFRAGLVWNKKAPGMGNPVRYMHECISVFSSGMPAPMGEAFSVITAYRDAELHPHQKPSQLMESTVNLFPGLVLDLFMGSGTTLVACAKLGRKGIGIELDPDYFDIACERVRKAYAQPDLFIAPPAQPKQEDMGL